MHACTNEQTACIHIMRCPMLAIFGPNQIAPFWLCVARLVQMQVVRSPQVCLACLVQMPVRSPQFAAMLSSPKRVASSKKVRERMTRAKFVKWMQVYKEFTVQDAMMCWEQLLWMKGLDKNACDAPCLPFLIPLRCSNLLLSIDDADDTN